MEETDGHHVSLRTRVDVGREYDFSDNRVVNCVNGRPPRVGDGVGTTETVTPLAGISGSVGP